MIATGGLLRISARKQDSFRSRNRVNARKQKVKKKRKNDVVVVKGKVKVCSVSGLIAVFGIFVLLVGIGMAVMGYWPKKHQMFEDRPSNKSPKTLHETSLFSSRNWSKVNQITYQAGFEVSNGSRTNVTNSEASPVGFWTEILSRYLHSDKLKVFGPLIMGIGIFLFICANAVLHENRDKKTKIINLRDIYSTVIDIHSLRTKDNNTPINGFVNYVQSSNIKPSDSFSAAVLAKSSLQSPLEGPVKQSPEQSETKAAIRHGSVTQLPNAPKDKKTLADTVYSIYRERYTANGKDSMLQKCETKSIVTSSISAFTLPVIKLNNCLLDEGSGRQNEDSAIEITDSSINVNPSVVDDSDADCDLKGNKYEEEERDDPNEGGSTNVNDSIKKETCLSNQGSDCPSKKQNCHEQDCHQQVGFPTSRAPGTCIDHSVCAPTSGSNAVNQNDCPSPLEMQDVTKDHCSSALESSDNKGYLNLGMEDNSFDSSDLSDCVPEDCPVVSNQNSSIENTEEETVSKNQKIIQRQYTNKEKLVMISHSHTSIQMCDSDLESSDI
ncbi:transmembrane protein 200C [Protopterus annectens]|uniref:transmembrane protein 200C n=1 Tax=Protopterus annectens TaxID=7888 RepID=UPI001CFAE732|nr:transmembrane protein 200C [Protopterus annectens]